MEEVFGTEFKRYKEVTEEEKAQYEEAKIRWEEDGCQGDEPLEPTSIISVPLEEVVPHSVKFIGLFFSASFCPPCKKLVEPIREFYEEFNKDLM